MVDMAAILNGVPATRWDEMPTWFLLAAASQLIHWYLGHTEHKEKFWEANSQDFAILTGDASDTQKRATALRWLTIN